MLLHGHSGPPAPPRLLTVQSARRQGYSLRVSCLPCGRHAVVEGASLPEMARSMAIGELWLAGRFRCAGCRRPATALEVIQNPQSLRVTAERWALGDPLLAERLRRHWRWDAYDRRDWAGWFRRA